MASTSAPFGGMYAPDWTGFDSSRVPTSTADQSANQPPELSPQVDQYDPFSPSITNWHNGQPLPLQQRVTGSNGVEFDNWSAGVEATGPGQQQPIPINLPQLGGNLPTPTHFDQQFNLTSGTATPQAEFQTGLTNGAPFDASWLPLHAGGPGWSQAYSPPTELGLNGFGNHGMSDWTANQIGQASFASVADGRIQTALAQAGLGTSTAPQWPPIPASTSPFPHDSPNLSLAQILAAQPAASLSSDFAFTSSAGTTPLYSPTDQSPAPFPPISPTGRQHNPFGSPLNATYPLFPEANQAGAFPGTFQPSTTTAALTPSPVQSTNALPIHPSPASATSPSTSVESGSPAPSASSSRGRRSISSPSNPAVPVVDPHHPAIARVAANRLRSGLNKAQPPSDKDGAVAPTPGVVKEKAGKVTLEVQAKCGSCGKVVAILSCRGKREDLARPHKPEYLCLECSPKRDEFEEEDPLPEEDKELKYATTISAVLDQLAGLELAKDEARPRAKPAGIGRRRRTEQEGLPCDVCARILGSGMMIDLATREAVSFAVEVICPRCASRYKRCSDCGGGGGDGGRIGPGRWRSKELFEPGRKVCKFSHRRQGPSDNMLYETWSLAEINALAPEQGAELRQLLRTTYVTFMLATLAIPEQLEAPGALARNFTECLKINEDHWAAFESVLSQDIEAATGIRRYIGLRWSLATVRKAPKDKEKAGKEGDKGEVLEAVPEPYPDGQRTLIPQGRILASFSAGEIELETGSMFQSLNFPKGIGEVYDQGSISIQRMITRIEHDIAELNLQRERDGLKLYPKLNVIWGMYMYKRSIPFLSRRGERRGFKLLEDYLALHPEDRKLFPPYRPCYVPVELLEGWEITVRKWHEGDDMTIPVGRNRRVDKAPKGAKIEEVY